MRGADPAGLRRAIDQQLALLGPSSGGGASTSGGGGGGMSASGMAMCNALAQVGMLQPVLLSITCAVFLQEMHVARDAYCMRTDLPNLTCPAVQALARVKAGCSYDEFVAAAKTLLTFVG